MFYLFKKVLVIV